MINRKKIITISSIALIFCLMIAAGFYFYHKKFKADVARVYKDYFDPNQIAHVYASSSDLTINQTVDKTSAPVGSILNYTITFRNGTSSPLKNIVINDVLSDQLALVSVPTGATVSRQIITWAIPTIKANSPSQTIKFQGKIQKNLPAITFVENFSDLNEGGWSYLPSGYAENSHISTHGISILTGNANSNATTMRTAYLSKDYGSNPLNLHGDDFRLTYYVPPIMADMPTQQGFSLYFFKDSGQTNRASLSGLPHAPGWNTVEFAESGVNYNPGGSMTNLSKVQRFIFYAQIPSGATDKNGNLAGPTNPWYVVLDKLEAWPETSTKGAVVFNFDDAYKSQVYNGVAYLHSKGFRSVMYTSGERMGTGVGEDEFATWDDVKAAADMGSLIATHAQFYTPTNTAEDVRAYYKKQKQYLIDHGYSVGANYWAIPQGQKTWACYRDQPGQLTAQQQYDLAREEFIHIRGTNPYWQDIFDGSSLDPTTKLCNRSSAPWGNTVPQPRNPRDWHWDSTVYITKDDSYNEKMVDRVVANKGVLTLATHGVSPNRTPVEHFNHIVDYVKSKVDAGQLEVITYQDMVNN